MLRATMIVLATAAVFTGGLTADAFARGGGGGHMGGFGGVHMGGALGGDHFDHGRRVRFGSGVGNLYDYECGYGYPDYNPYTYSCYPPE